MKTEINMKFIQLFAFLIQFACIREILTDNLDHLYRQKLAVIKGKFDEVYKNHTNSNATVIYEFEYNEIKNQVYIYNSSFLISWMDCLYWSKMVCPKGMTL